LIFLSGFWLTRSGKPYNAIVLTVHKLISAAAVVFLVVTMVQVNKAARLNAGELAASVVTGLFFIGTFATGALLTADKPMPAVVLWLHRITPFLTVLASAATLYLSLGRR
jgi:succinate dehydrogenase/fumarate reductase cytochrome b subunit